MLGENDAMATIAVADIERARSFYSGKLGLKELPGSPNPDVITYASGNSRVLVYRSDYAGTNKATAATWSIEEDLENLAADLKSKGVVFEHYDIPELTLRGDVHVGSYLSVVWFKDPDGNTLSILRTH